jgi:hypothetical protein
MPLEAHLNCSWRTLDRRCGPNVGVNPILLRYEKEWNVGGRGVGVCVVYQVSGVCQNTLTYRLTCVFYRLHGPCYVSMNEISLMVCGV